MTTMNEVHADTLRPLPRLTLRLHDGRVVYGVATFTGASVRVLDKQPLYLLKDIELEDGTQTGHCWVHLEPFVRKHLTRGQRFSFRGRVLSYTRRDKSVDWTFSGISLKGE